MADDAMDLMARVQAERHAKGLTVRYISPFTGEEVQCTRANEKDKADFCARIVRAGGRIL